MHVLFTRFPLESTYGGAEVQTLTLMRGFKEQGHEVNFLGSCPVLLEESGKLKVESTKLDIGRPPVTKWDAVSFVWRKRTMKKKLVERIRAFLERDAQRRVERPFHSPALFSRDVGSVEESLALFMLSLSEKLLLTEWAVEHGIKVFWIEHDRIGRWLRWNPWLPQLRRLSRRATTITVSDLSRDLYLDLGWDPERTVSIPNGIDVEKFAGNGCRGAPSGHPGHASGAPLHTTRASPLRLGCIARLTRDKGVDVLLEAIGNNRRGASLRRPGHASGAPLLPNVSLTIVGDGPEARNIQRLVRRINEQRLPAAVNVISTVQNIAEFYRAIEVLILPSRDHDPFGLVVAEAMAAGIPTILTDACGIARHLTAEEAIIVPAGDPVALRRAIAAMQREDVRKKLAASGPHVAEEKFSSRRMVKDYEKLLAV